MMEADNFYALVVIGSGAGGAEAALLAARRGVQRVLLVDKGPVGGGAVLAGTMPMRSLMASARLLRQFRHAADLLGLNLDENEIGVRLSDWVSRQRHAVARLAYSLREELRAAGVEIARGHARLLGDGRLRIRDDERERRPGEGAERELRAAHIILATGSKPAPLSSGAAAPPEAAVTTSRSFVSLAETPASLIIIGGGHIGCEFATVHRALGAAVTLIEKGERLLPEMDREAGEWLGAALAARGVSVLLSREAHPEWRAGPGESARVRLGPEGEGELTAERVLLATGRLPNVENLGLEEAGVHYSAERGITVDEFLQTSAPGISAVGDVNCLCTLADSARAQARVAVDNALGARVPFHPHSTPRCVHSDPAVAAVGLSEDEANARGRRVRAGSAVFRSSQAPLGGVNPDEAGGSVKLVADAESRQLLGGTIVGEHAAEWIDEFSVALRFGASAEDFVAAPRANTPFAEALQVCARAMFG